MKSSSRKRFWEIRRWINWPAIASTRFGARRAPGAQPSYKMTTSNAIGVGCFLAALLVGECRGQLTSMPGIANTNFTVTNAVPSDKAFYLSTR
jgi:hypothetical protein